VVSVIEEPKNDGTALSVESALALKLIRKSKN
jgi:hypothetical protein